MSRAHIAVENGDIEALRILLDEGVDVHEEHYGLTLLHHAVDAEIDGHVQTGEPLHVDTTAYLLSRGADPLRPASGQSSITADQMAHERGHWLAVELFDAWKVTHRMRRG
ncbi:ankyrin repeat domain-containing protein [Amycolatopsis carbonis]|uniref:Ankyrin repeat domain-containing protein n=1 Tax=Amycolatopsis carbonis TaxID=715471 RepID=A0A9Y2IBN5_9PSEU|nr:ankyrin repeat domain-containing protein [Amycolatopsis sp. 2-15]WIX76949.1 ankyrin repeat domain-containing protein [Amycolatopsis sp. 2-15]